MSLIKRNPRVYRLYFNSGDRVAGTVANSTFWVNLPVDFLEGNRYAMAVESFMTNATTYNSTLDKQAYHLRLRGLNQETSFSSYQNGNPTDILCPVYGYSRERNSPLLNTAIPIVDKSLLQGRRWNLYLTRPSTTISRYTGTQFVNAPAQLEGTAFQEFNELAQVQATGTITTSAPLSTLTGTIGATAGTTSIVGTGTTFTSQVAYGDLLYKTDGTFIGIVASIQSDTALTLQTASPITAVGSTFAKAVSCTLTGTSTTFTTQLAVGMPIYTTSGTSIGIITAIASATSATLTPTQNFTTAIGSAVAFNYCPNWNVLWSATILVWNIDDAL
jgi:hypothetical protein